MAEEKKLLEIENLRKYFPVNGIKGPGVQAVQDVSLYIKKGETLGLVGESGCGKTTLGRTILRLYEPTGGKIIYDGETIYDNPLDKDGKRLGKAKAAKMLPYRRKMQIIFQDPSASLDPRMTVGEIIGEAIDIHKLAASKKDRADMIKDLLAQVGLNTEHANRYPHEFSGGQKQRVGIARALANDPTVLLSDEATSALDPETTTSTLALLRKINKELGVTIVMITHQMEVVKQICERIVVMDHGEVIEEGSVLDVFRNPRHPTTRSMLSGILCTELPAQVVQHIRDIFKAHPNDCNKALRITFVGEEATEPVIATCATRYGVNFNILAGQISEIQESTFSSLTVVCSCSQEAYNRVREYLISNNIQIEELNDAVNA